MYKPFIRYMIFSQTKSLTCLFILTVAFKEQTFLISMKSQLTIFLFFHAVVWYGIVAFTSCDFFDR